MRLCLSMLPAVLLSAPSLAQQAAGKFADPASAGTMSGSGVAQVSQVSVALLVVLAVIFVSVWLMRRVRLFPTQGQATLQVIQGVNLGPKERAVLIKVQDRRLLLGVAPGCVNLLAELPADDTTNSDASAAVQVQGAASDAPNFKALLKRSMGLS